MTHAEQALGIYVHIPFCLAKCTYCHFAIDPGTPGEERQERYLRSLIRELGRGTAARADTLYFGGGTPSLMSPPRLAGLMGAMRERFPMDPTTEVTLEANPSDLGAEDYRALRDVGVNRLSLGVQSFHDEVLREMGRLHTGTDAYNAVELARGAGFENVSVDLILGWPGETRERWLRNLEGLADVAPDHVSLYVLEVEGRTLLSHRARQGRLSLPDDDLVADLYRWTVEALGQRGIERYEISNFARPGFESRHNAKYWDDAPFLGFGMSAHSYGDGRRFWNVATYGGYVKAMEDGDTAVAGERVLSPEERASEAAFTGLRRRAGLDLSAFRARYGVDLLKEYGPPLADCFAAMLVEVADGRLRLTDRGVLVSNDVFRAFV